MSDWYQKAKTVFKITSVDLDRLKSLEDLDDGGHEPLLITVIDLYFQSGPEQLDQITTAIKSNNISLIHTTAHALKSSSSNMGAVKLSNFLNHLEDQSASPPAATDFTELFQEIESEFEHVCTDLEIIKNLVLGKAVPKQLPTKVTA